MYVSGYVVQIRLRYLYVCVSIYANAFAHTCVINIQKMTLSTYVTWKKLIPCALSFVCVANRYPMRMKRSDSHSHAQCVYVHMDQCLQLGIHMHVCVCVCVYGKYQNTKINREGMCVCAWYSNALESYAVRRMKYTQTRIWIPSFIYLWILSFVVSAHAFAYVHMDS